MSEQPDAPDPALVSQGHMYLRIALGFLILTSIATSIVYAIRLGPSQLPQQVVRLALLLVLGYFVLKGRMWARWLMLALLIAALLVFVPVVTRRGAFSAENLTTTLVLLAVYVGYAVIARGLIYSDSVRAFFRAHRGTRLEGNGNANTAA